MVDLPSSPWWICRRTVGYNTRTSAFDGDDAGSGSRVLLHTRADTAAHDFPSCGYLL